jgi:hypothetical protein
MTPEQIFTSSANTMEYIVLGCCAIVVAGLLYVITHMFGSED